MTNPKRCMTILVADDDPDDCFLTKKAFTKANLTTDLYFVADGEELMDFLHRQGRYRNPERAPRPGLILLDLNMPKKDGREAIREIKGDSTLRRIPVVVLTTSKSKEDIVGCYDLGVSSFITKPATFSGLVEIIKVLDNYWFNIVELPSATTV